MQWNEMMNTNNLSFASLNRSRTRSSSRGPYNFSITIVRTRSQTDCRRHNKTCVIVYSNRIRLFVWPFCCWDEWLHLTRYATAASCCCCSFVAFLLNLCIIVSLYKWMNESINRQLPQCHRCHVLLISFFVSVSKLFIVPTTATAVQ